jgi:hypothetical protein
MRKKPSVPMTVLGAASALSLAAGAPADAQTGTKAGVAAAVRGPVQQVSFRTPSATVGRNVASGDEIFLGDRIVTGPVGGLQIMLLDGTTFTIGPNSSMVIDEFVYNPANGTGKITASVTRGTLRLISGRIGRQEQEAIKIKLPIATVGIRGSIVAFTGGPNGFLLVLSGVGPNNSADRPPSGASVLSGGVLAELFQSGWGCLMTLADPVCKPQPIGPEQIQQLLGQVGGQVRFVDLSLTNIDLVEALKMMGQPGGFEDFWNKINQLFQDANRPGDFVPPSPPVNGSGGIFN